jgi:SAM-dependent methyltransferase
MGVFGRKQASPSPEAVLEAVRKKYSEVSRTAEGKFAYPTGRQGALALGYEASAIDAMPPGLIESFCGVGNPFSLGPVRPGEAVLDVGCGTGFDLIVAGRLVGPSGRVCGIDVTQEMVEKAGRNLIQAALPHGEVRVAGAEEIPYEDGSFALVISNGVLNLSPLKEKCFREIYRVLRPGGRLQFADIVLKADLPEKVSGSLEAWSD